MRSDASAESGHDNRPEVEDEKMESATDQGKEKESSKQNNEFSPELLAQYYSRLFPFHFLHSWLSYNSSHLTLPESAKDAKKSDSAKANDIFSHREFSFTIEPTPGEEIYIRYQSFANQQSFANAVLKRNPRKIDIGAVFSHQPKDHNTIQGSKSDWRKFHPKQRELVFDIDLTDYDPVRRCGCKEAKICNKCWTMMEMAIKVMESGLREDFGFRNIVWFYSGRRGVHAWVCDKAARELSDEGRSAVASYFEMNLGTEKNQEVELTNPIHPCLQRAHKILESYFLRDIIPDTGHGILSDEPKWKELLATLPPAASSVASSLTSKWEKDGDISSTPEEKWDELKRYLNVLIGKSGQEKKSKKIAKNMSAADKNKIELWPIATVLRFTYPRLDINVSKMQNHLLKSPFCVHPKTGRVCVPIDVRKVEEFDPFEVPTVAELVRELDEYSDLVDEDEGASSNKRGGVKHEWEKTSLKDSFKYFEEEFLMPICKEWRKEERAMAEERAGIMVDF